MIDDVETEPVPVPEQVPVAEKENRSAMDLVRQFNELASSKAGKELGKKPVTRFPTVAMAQKRLDALVSSIRAWENGGREEEKRDAEAAAQVENQSMAADPAEGEAKKPKRTKKAKPTNEKEETMASVSMKKIIEDCKLREGTNQYKLTTYLIENKGKQLPSLDLIRHVYGKKDKSLLGALKGAIAGVDRRLKQIGMTVKSGTSDDGITFGVFKA
jgi:hypothetical protein